MVRNFARNQGAPVLPIEHSHVDARELLYRAQHVGEAVVRHDGEVGAWVQRRWVGPRSRHDLELAGWIPARGPSGRRERRASRTYAREVGRHLELFGRRENMRDRGRLRVAQLAHAWE